MIGNFSDPCSMAPIYACAGGCHGDSDVESVSIFSGSRKKSSKLPEHPMSPTGRLMKRISDYQVKGWLSQQEHRKYAALLSTTAAEKQQQQNADENAAPTVAGHVLQELEKELDQMEERFGDGTMLNKTMRTSAVLTPSNRSFLSTPNSERPHGLSVFPEPKSAIIPKPNKGGNEMGEMTPLVVDPQELHKAVDITNAELQELFTEMCFFARLGFVQPPCCLRCTYRESMKEAVPNTACPKWVVWRKNAQTLLHPSQMDGNVVVVQCQAARRLLAGETLGIYKWDKNKKILTQE